MLLNVSYNNPEITKKINSKVGKAFPLIERFKMNGIGSPKLFINSSSLEIHNLLILDNNRNVCNIEMRPQGIILGFRSLLESYALVIPFYKLNIYKEKAEEYSIYKDHYYVKVSATDKPTHRFFQKLINYKIDNAPPQIEDL